jgi:hypothetical protein
MIMAPINNRPFYIIWSIIGLIILLTAPSKALAFCCESEALPTPPSQNEQSLNLFKQSCDEQLEIVYINEQNKTDFCYNTRQISDRDKLASCVLDGLTGYWKWFQARCGQLENIPDDGARRMEYKILEMRFGPSTE